MNVADLKGNMESVVRFKKKGHSYNECAGLLALAVRASEDLDQFMPMVRNVCRNSYRKD